MPLYRIVKLPENGGFVPQQLKRFRWVSLRDTKWLGERFIGPTHEESNPVRALLYCVFQTEDSAKEEVDRRKKQDELIRLLS